MTPESPARSTPAYQERLGLPWWVWPAGLLIGAILGTEVALALPGLPGWLPYAVLVPLAVLLPLPLGRLRVAVREGEFLVDDARLPVAVIADVVALDAAGKREALGVGAHPLAFVVQRPWIGGAVQVLLDDPADPTPYWVVSTRRPVELATALLAVSRPARAGQASSEPAS
ncbi:hypothetical protein ACWT_6978 [Actinoplanes sp. SE50]|uniref:DUF3093 domain-containing protein n=1 Tax=unclassified Actinoplanes TaxID=2626549 RepID=UPI00023EC1B2|nr:MULTISPECIES: DUF3093 domain-containing protein [unclassified Actinoplanes]AEV87989.1 hypothetical protein ACPL_7109 [Actinoplanes sp. SE50/110]ATO86393.1 hypothetical protein ACWT_6978 [Actinoplanes sp. SE50]SLM03808.1 hypothetical protein ACSP50_7107 [Actinoplanes sp. SE50/110]